MTTRKKYILGGLVLLLIIAVFAFRSRVTYSTPDVSEPDFTSMREFQSDDSIRLGSNWLALNRFGEWESYVEGDALTRGFALGRIQENLIQNQERVFVSEIEKHLPNAIGRNLMRLGVAWFNRNLDQSIPTEYRHEIYGISTHFADEYDFVGPKFNRIINYHAAHDIGHMAQNLHLVACTSIGEWDDKHFYFGRNFDFYFGDEFAKNKIIQFYVPDEGYAFASVTWAGFCGVVSGMNEAGLGITLHSLPSEIPTSSATPVSIIARDIVQHAATIDEAVQIARQYSCFVSESFTVVSRRDSSAAIIEKTPDSTYVFYPPSSHVTVTNHFQSEPIAGSVLNIDHMANTETTDRFERMEQLRKQDTSKLSPQRIMHFLRDQSGLNEEDLGLGNPMAINQLLAHHAVIFDPYNLRMWVSQSPYQEGHFMAYDISAIRTSSGKSPRIDSLTLQSDPFLETEGYERFVEYKKGLDNFKQRWDDTISPEEFNAWIALNPKYYLTHMTAGTYFADQGDSEKAKAYYQSALQLPIPYESDREIMETYRLENP